MFNSLKKLCFVLIMQKRKFMEKTATKTTRANMENEDCFIQLLETAEIEYRKYLIQKLSVSKYDFFKY